MRGGRELVVPGIGVNHALSEEPFKTRKALVESMIDALGAPEVRGRELVWNLEHIANREQREVV